jgi:hypothetical protein
MHTVHSTQVSSLVLGTLPDGDILIAGVTGPSALLDDKPLTPPVPGAESYLYTARLSPEGALRWSFSPTSSPGWSEVDDLAVDPHGDVVIVGWFQKTLGLSGAHRLTTPYEDGYVAKLEGKTGALVWAHALTSGSSALNRVTVAPNGDVIVAGHFKGSVAAGGAPLHGHQAEDIVVARYTGDGKPVWSVVPEGEPGARNVLGLAMAGEDVVLVRDRSFNIEGRPHYTWTEAGLVSLSAADGRRRWSRWFGAPALPSGDLLPAAMAGDPNLVGVRNSWVSLVAVGGELQVAVLAKGAVRHGDAVYGASPAEVPYVLSYSLAGEPRRSVRLDPPRVHALGLFMARTGDSVALLGSESHGEHIYCGGGYLVSLRPSAAAGAVVPLE